MRKIMQRLAAGLLVFVAAFTLTHKVAWGAWPDPEADLGVLRVLASGSVAWRMEVVSNALTFTDNVTSGAAQLKLYPNNGGLGLQSRTDANLQTDAPGAAGALIWNSTAKAVCVSTGTGAGAYIFLSTGTTTNGAFTVRACHT